jgi:hypothetical protein
LEIIESKVDAKKDEENPVNEFEENTAYGYASVVARSKI